MNLKKLGKLQRELEGYRRPAVKASKLEGLAKSLGRRLEGKTGKEPNWVSHFSHLRAISIPHHGGADLATGTKHIILDALEEDCVEWEALLVGATNGDQHD